jgi:hypothetical protein
MVSEREQAKKSITDRQADDPELRAALEQAHSRALELKQAEYEHIQASQKTALGLGGWILGNEKNAPNFVAFIAVVFGFVVFCICLWLASRDATNLEFWGRNAERALAVSATALAYIFGRGSPS